jgi:hypothetical protein
LERGGEPQGSRGTHRPAAGALPWRNTLLSARGMAPDDRSFQEWLPNRQRRWRFFPRIAQLRSIASRWYGSDSRIWNSSGPGSWCVLACTLYAQLGLDAFWAEKLRKGTRWEALCCYRLIDPGSEWRLNRHWYEASAMADLLGAGFELVEIHKLYECLNRLLEHKRDPTLEGSLQHEVRHTPLRSDQHILREQSSLPGRRQEEIRP